MYSLLKKVILNIFCLFVLSMSLLAVQAIREPLVYTQPDGTQITVYLNGDEYFSYYTKVSDNSILIRDSLGFLQPADFSFIEQQFSSPRVLKARKQTRLQSTFPTTGTVRSVVLLVNFSDLSFVIEQPQQQFTRLLNEKGYNDNGGTGSANEYFVESSAGQFNPQFDVYGPFTLAHERSYYGENSYRTDGTLISHSKRVGEMVVEACNLAVNAGVDFSLYDENNDGVIDNVFIYYAGYNEAEGGDEDCIWAHRSRVTTASTFNGKDIKDYACTSELKGKAGTNMCGIGTFCHEFGHVLGLPDLYNVSNSSSYTLGSWDIMSNGNYNNNGRTPPAYSAFERFMLGWLTPTQITQSTNYILQPIESTNTALLIAATDFNGSTRSPAPDEYFLLENRQRIGWDAPYYPNIKDANGVPYQAIPGVGMLISHITFDENKYDNNSFNSSKPLGCDIVEAYNENPNASSASDTYPGLLEITKFMPTLNDGTTLDSLQLSNIYQEGDNSVSFYLGKPDGKGFTFNPERLPTILTTYNAGIVDFTEQQLQIIGTDLTTDSISVTLSNSNFQIKLDDEWLERGQGFTDTINKVSKTYNKTISIRHTPSRQNCSTTSARLNIKNINGQYTNQLTLVGTAPRPIYITDIIPKEPITLSPYSFTASWQAQTDAERYFLTLFTLQNEPAQIVQGFEQFDSIQHIQSNYWDANFARTNTINYKSGKASVSFSQSGEYITTEPYYMPVSEVSFYLSNTFLPSSEDTPKGILTLEALSSNSDDWIIIDSIEVLRTTRDIIKQYNVKTLNAFKFRLTYTYVFGTGEVQIDDFTAYIDSTANYIYDKDGLELIAPIDSLLIAGLTPNTTYYYYLRCEEEKGCEKHTTSFNSTSKVTTPAGITANSQFTISQKDENTLVAYMPITMMVGSQIVIFDSFGRKVSITDITEQTTQVDISTTGLVDGNIYIAKYIENNNMQRKQYWAKIFLQ